jgi:HD-GYP domain-containing protein (c-di-GMP phosphodiesterase class II)
MSIELDEIKIFSPDLEIGMFVTRLDRPWEEANFLLQGFLIETPEDIENVQEQCDYVYIERKTFLRVNASKRAERRKAKDGLFARQSASRSKTSSKSNQTAARVPPPSGPKQNPPRKKTTYINKVPVEKEFDTAKQCYGYAKTTAKSIMEGIRVGRTIDINACRESVSSIVDSIIRNSNALVWLSKLKNKDEYTAEHSLNVCILTIAFARHLGHSEKEIRRIGLCALLHDVGKAKIPIEILNKPGRFTDEEFELMKQHSTFGRDLLISMSDTDMAAIDVAYCHHERMDETGYPRQLQRHQIPYYARIVAITDTYDAITSSRCYDSGRSSMDALDIIYKSRGLQFDEELALEFIKCIGIYPPGSIVETTNGEVGIVIASNKEVKLKPRMIMVLNANKKPRRQQVINLVDNPIDSFGEKYAIACELPNKKYGVDIRDFVKKGLVLDR